MCRAGFGASVTAHTIDFGARCISVRDMSETMHWLPDADADGRLRPIFDAMLEGVIVRDAAGKIVASNRTAREILRVSAEQLAGHDFESLSMRYLRED